MVASSKRFLISRAGFPPPYTIWGYISYYNRVRCYDCAVPYAQRYFGICGLESHARPYPDVVADFNPTIIIERHIGRSRFKIKPPGSKREHAMIIMRSVLPAFKENIIGERTIFPNGNRSVAIISPFDMSATYIAFRSQDNFRSLAFKDSQIRRGQIIVKFYLFPLIKTSIRDMVLEESFRAEASRLEYAPIDDMFRRYSELFLDPFRVMIRFIGRYNDICYLQLLYWCLLIPRKEKL